MRRNASWIVAAAVLGLAVIRVAGCAASPSDPVVAGGECDDADVCVEGTVCVRSRCVADPCIDEDGDGAGTGPGCSAYDCDDSDPTVPADMELCNDRDDDCDDARDEGCPCLAGGEPVPNGSTRACGLADCAGTQTCLAGTWGECVRGRTPEAFETCFNEVDDNCDGSRDEGCCPADEIACVDIARCSSNGMCV